MAVSSFETSSHGHVIKARRVRAARREKLLGILSPLLTDLGFGVASGWLSSCSPVLYPSPSRQIPPQVPIPSTYSMITSARQ